MNDSSPRVSADSNLLFGILALRAGHIDRDALVDAIDTWADDRTKSIGKILCQNGKLPVERQIMLEALVEERLSEDAALSEDTSRDLSCLAHNEFAANDRLGSASLSRISTAFYANGNVSAPSVPSGTANFECYRIIQPHAKGGFGEVYLARDVALDRDVALKEIQKEHANDTRVRRRFVREATITGGLEHPGIIPIHALGAHSEGQPFYVMPFVRGESLKDAIDRFHQSDIAGGQPNNRSLEFRQLLRRFVDICNAVAYAHSRGVIHRDIKPGNVMLGQFGETMIIDWGLAKKVEENSDFGSQNSEPKPANNVVETQPGAVVGTPAYMSPEQVGGRLDEVGLATDIYGLGATLFTVLTGEPPFRGTDRTELMRTVQDGAFPQPRQVRNDVPAALEAICLKAMARDVRARYASALDLAAELEHWLADEPVAAYREPWRERARRFLRKHRTLATSAAAMLLVAVVLSTSAALLLNVARANEQQARFDEAKQKEAAQTAQDQAEAVTKFLVDAFRSPDPSIDGRDIKVTDLLDRAVIRIDKEFANDPAILEKLLDAIGMTYQGLGMPARAVDLLKRSMDLQRARLGTDHSHTRSTMKHLAMAYGDAGRYAEELELVNEILSITQTQFGPNHPETLGCIGPVALAYIKVGRGSEARPLLERLRRSGESELDTGDANGILPRANLALAYLQLGQFEDAVPVYEKVLHARRTQRGLNHPETLASMSNLAGAYRHIGRIEEAMSLFEEAVKLQKTILGPDHPDTLSSMYRLSIAYLKAARHSDAISLLEESLQLTKAKFGPDHPSTLKAMSALATGFREARRESDAIRLMTETVPLLEMKFGANHPRTLTAMNNLAMFQRDIGDFKQSLASLEEILRRRREANADRVDVATTLTCIGDCLLRQKQYSAAEKTLRDAMETMEKPGPDHWVRYAGQIMLGQSLMLQRKFDEAEPTLIAGYEGMSSQKTMDIPEATRSMTYACNSLVRIYETTNRTDKAAEWRVKRSQLKAP